MGRISILSLMLVVLVSSTALAQSPEQRAHLLYKEGKQLMLTGNLEKAIAKFTEAWKTYEHPLIIKKRAEANERLLRYEEAIDDYNAYREKVRKNKKEQRLINERVAALESLLQQDVKVTITTAAAGVKVTIGDRDEQTTPFDVTLKPGIHKAVVTDNRYMSTSKDLRVKAGRDQAIKVQTVPRTGRLVIQTDQSNFENTELILDGVPINLDPSDVSGDSTSPRQVVVGEHTLVCRSDDSRSYYTSFEVTEGSDAVVVCAFSSVSGGGILRDTWGWVTAGSGILSTITGIGLLVSYSIDVETAEKNNQELITNKHTFGGVMLAIGVGLGVGSYFVFTRHVAPRTAKIEDSKPVWAIIPTPDGPFFTGAIRF